MYPIISNTDTHANVWKFSSCSVDEISTFVEAEGYCLEEPDPCAGGDTPEALACCENGQLRANGTLCRERDEMYPCERAGYCNGVDPHCPQSELAPDGSFCDVTLDGVKTHSHCCNGMS